MQPPAAVAAPEEAGEETRTPPHGLLHHESFRLRVVPNEVLVSLVDLLWTIRLVMIADQRDPFFGLAAVAPGFPGHPLDDDRTRARAAEGVHASVHGIGQDLPVGDRPKARNSGLAARHTRRGALRPAVS